MSPGRIPKRLKTDNLMLLLGTNPLPNYIAASILANPNTKLHIVQTDSIRNTKIPERLLKLLGRDPSDQTQYISISSIDPWDIFDKVYTRVLNTSGSWGLHYTGGKKIMATHAYRATEHALAESDRLNRAVFSYLDADTLALICEEPGQPIRYFSSKLQNPLMLWQLIYLHGKPEETVKLARWEDYPEGYFESLSLKKKPQRIPFQPSVCEDLKNAKITKDEREFEGIQKRLEATASQLSREISEIKFWFSEHMWLEHFVLDRILSLQGRCGITDYAHGFESHIFEPINIGAEKFESDVLAIQNYRLFYFSVTRSENKKNNKLKLFEAYARAQQLGGEQAKAVLVTLYEDPEGLRRELYDERHIQVYVFGPDDMRTTTEFEGRLEDLFSWPE